MSLGEALSISTGDETRLKLLVNRWIRATLVAQGERMIKKSHSQESPQGVASPLHAVKRLYFYNRLPGNFDGASLPSSEIGESNSTSLVSIFSRLCTALTRLLGTKSNEKARYHLLVGVICSGDRHFIEFARSVLVQEPESDPTWRAALKYAIRVYFDATSAFGVGELNEELGALCLSLLPSSENSPEFNFHGALKFLAGIDRLSSYNSLLPSWSGWANMSLIKKSELFVEALQNLLHLAYLNEVNLIQAGKYFGLTDVKVSRCFLKAAIQTARQKPLASAVAKKTVVLMQEVLSAPEASAWCELRLWMCAPAEVLGSLFTNVENSTVERFRLTLGRFVITHSVHEAGCSEYAQICSEFAEICAFQKSLTVDDTDNCPSLTQRLLSALAPSYDSATRKSKPRLPCAFYLSPLDPTRLEDVFSSSQSMLMSAFLLSWASKRQQTETVHDVWMNDCLTEKSLDVGLYYAYGPPLGLRARNWTKKMCMRFSQAIDADEMEDYRLIAASVSANADSTGDVFPSTRTLLESLARLSAKHPLIARWRSKALVSRLVSEPDKFFADAAYRRSELFAISQTHPKVSLLLARHMEESRSQLVLNNLSKIVFPTSDVDPDVTKRQLKDISSYLRNDVHIDDLTAYLKETIDLRVEQIPLWRLVLLLKVLLAVMGGHDADLCLRGVSIKRHLDYLHPIIHSDTSVYFAFLSSLDMPNESDFLIRVQPHLTSKSAVEFLIALIRKSDSSLIVNDAQIYAAYASRLLIESNQPIDSCIDCFDNMITIDGEASELVGWVSKNLFGAEALVRFADLEGRIKLIGAAIRVISTKSSDISSVELLRHLEADLQRRLEWTKHSTDQSFLSEPLQQRLLLHHFENIDEVPVLLLQAVREFLSKSQIEFTEAFSVMFSAFIAFVQRIARLLCVDFDSVTLKAVCEGINEFLSANLTDWVYLDPSSQTDLVKSDQVIIEFVKSRPNDQQVMVISLLLSWCAPRQLFGRALLQIDPSEDNHLTVARKTFNHVLWHYDLVLNSSEEVIPKLFDYIQGHETPINPIGWLLGEDGAINAGLIQAVAIAIELTSLCWTDKSNALTQRETKLWKSCLECFVRHPLLTKFPWQLVSRVHLARFPSTPYFTAVQNLEADGDNWKEVFYSCKLLSSTAVIDLPTDVKLDPIACRRFLARVEIWRTSDFPVSILDAVLEVAANPHYHTFLQHVLRGMRAAGDAWIEMALLSRVTLLRNSRSNSMEELLKAVEELLST